MATVKQRVDTLVKKYRTADPRELCDYLNITVLETELNQQMQGFFMRVEDEFFIFVNKDQSDQDKKATVAHELGHRVLHPQLNSLFMTRNTLMHPGRYEHEADVFACHLLVDDEQFQRDSFGCDTLERISWELDVPLDFVELKWEELKNS